jgi:hypothetical protein
MAACQVAQRALAVAHCFSNPFFELSFEILGQIRIRDGGAAMSQCDRLT